jgi:hypothetical protein
VLSREPAKTPLCYRNITGPDGKKIIATDAAISPLIAKPFDWHARGDISLKEAARKAHAAGLLYPKSEAKVPVSTVHTILRNRLYTGWFEWNGSGQARGAGAGRPMGARGRRPRRPLRQKVQTRPA